MKLSSAVLVCTILSACVVAPMATTLLAQSAPTVAYRPGRFKPPAIKYSDLFVSLEEGRRAAFAFDMTRTDPAFQALLDGYLTSYGLLCSQYLPEDREPWRFPVCDEQQRRQDGEFECVKDHKLVLVDRNILEMKNKLMFEALADEISIIRTSPNPVLTAQEDLRNISTNPGLQDFMVALWHGGNEVVVMNGCLSPELRRFQDNLIRFATGQPLLSVAIPMTSPNAIPPRVSPPLPRGLPALAKSDVNNTDLTKIIVQTMAAAPPSDTIFREIAISSISNIRLTAPAPLSWVPRGTSVETYLADCKIDWAVDPPPCALYLSFVDGRPSLLSMKLDGPGVSVPDDLVTRFEAGEYRK